MRSQDRHTRCLRGSRRWRSRDPREVDLPRTSQRTPRLSGDHLAAESGMARVTHESGEHRAVTFRRPATCAFVPRSRCSPDAPHRALVARRPPASERPRPRACACDSRPRARLVPRALDLLADARGVRPDKASRHPAIPPFASSTRRPREARTVDTGCLGAAARRA